MGSKKKTLSPGEMRPLSALKKQGVASPKKKNAPTRVPQPQKLPQYGIPTAGAAQNAVSNLQGNIQLISEDENNKIDNNTPINAEEAAAVLFKSIREMEKNKSESRPEALSQVQTHNSAGSDENPKSEAKIKEKVEIKEKSVLDLKSESKHQLKTELTPEPKPKAVSVEVREDLKREPVHAAFIRPAVKPLAEYRQEAKHVIPARKRGLPAPDLSNKAERDAFFSKYTTLSDKRKNESFPDITEEYIRQQESSRKEDEEKKKQKRRNPFLTARTGKTVISHAKEEPTAPPIGAKPAGELRDEALEQVMDILNDNIQEGVQSSKSDKIVSSKSPSENTENSFSDTATAEMRETIEGVVEHQRKEREEARARVCEDETAEKMRRKSSLIRSVGIMGVMIFCAAFLLFGKRSDFSAEENRKLATMPEFSLNSYLSGEYTEGVSVYYNDTVPMRSTFKKAISSMQNWKGIPTNNEEDAEFFGNVSVKDRKSADNETVQATQITDVSELINSVQTTAVTSQTAVTTTTEPEEYEPPVEVGDSIIIHKKRAISFYGGLDSIAESYANTLNDFKSELPGVNVYSLIAPTSVSFYLPDEYKDYTASEKEKIEYTNKFFKNVKSVDAYSALEQHKDENIYARTDHHWLPLGAYYAAEEFAKTAGVPFTDISNMDSETKDDYVGTMYTFTESTILSENPEEFTYYKPKNKYKTEYYTPSFEFNYEGDLLVDISDFDPVAYYLVFMLGDDKIVHVSTDVNNDRTLVIFKDSYGNAMVPCLVGSFSDIYVCDIRYFNLNAAQFCRDVGATDLLFAMNTFSATGVNEECIEQILYYQ